MSEKKPFIPNHKFGKEPMGEMLMNVVTTYKGRRSLIGEDDSIIGVINMYSQKYRRSLQASNDGELYFNSDHGTVYLRQISAAFSQASPLKSSKSARRE